MGLLVNSYPVQVISEMSGMKMRAKGGKGGQLGTRWLGREVGKGTLNPGSQLWACLPYSSYWSYRWPPGCQAEAARCSHSLTAPWPWIYTLPVRRQDRPETDTHRFHRSCRGWTQKKDKARVDIDWGWGKGGKGWTPGIHEGVPKLHSCIWSMGSRDGRVVEQNSFIDAEGN